MGWEISYRGGGISEHTCEEEQGGNIVSVHQDRMTSSAEDTSRHIDYTLKRWRRIGGMDTLGEKCVHNTEIKRGGHETSRHTDYTLTFHHHPEVEGVGISEHTCEEQGGNIVSVNQDRMTSSAEDTSRHTDYTLISHLIRE